jgi:hypothetical protein
MKLKKLTKKIRLLEARLQKGAKKLAKLKQKLGAATKAGGAGAPSTSKKKSTARSRAARRAGKSSTTMQKKGRRLTTKPQVRSAVAKRPSPAKKVKRKLNLSPERRAQLAAAMKARWAAKRAAVEANPQDTSTSTSLDFTLGQASQAP